MKWQEWLILGVGLFAAYTISVVMIAIWTKKAVNRLIFVAQYAPWCLVSQSFGQFVLAA